VELHRALTGQAEPRAALAAAAAEMRRILAAAEARPERPGGRVAAIVLLALGAAGLALVVRRVRREPAAELPSAGRLGWLLAAPAALVVAAVALFPLAWTLWESLHDHDLRLPWRGRPFVAAANYVALAGDARFRGALAHTAVFVAVSVT